MLLDSFLKSNGIAINESKTKYMILTPKNKLTNNLLDSIEIRYNCKPLIRSDSIIMLGVTIDRKLTFSAYIEDIMRNKLSKYIPIFYNIRNAVSIKSLLLIYYTNIYSS